MTITCQASTGRPKYSRSNSFIVFDLEKILFIKYSQVSHFKRDKHFSLIRLCIYSIFEMKSSLCFTKKLYVGQFFSFVWKKLKFHLYMTKFDSQIMILVSKSHQKTHWYVGHNKTNLGLCKTLFFKKRKKILF